MTRSESLRLLSTWAGFYRSPDIIAQRATACPLRGEAVRHGLNAVRAVRDGDFLVYLPDRTQGRSVLEAKRAFRCALSAVGLPAVNGHHPL